MTIAQGPQGYVARPSPSGLVDVIDLILDKGLVIDIYLRVSVVGIEILTIDARIVIASVDTYLRFAEAVNRLDLKQDKTEGLPELIGDMTEGGAKHKTKGALEGVRDTAGKVIDRVRGDDDDDEDEQEEYDRPRRRPATAGRRHATAGRRERDR
jgi:hypothetical protein